MKNKSYSNMAKALGMKKSKLYAYMTGRRSMPWFAAKKFAARIGGDPEIWLNEGGTPEQREHAVIEYFINKRG